MLDIQHIPGAKSDTQIFYAQGATAWQTCVKPRNAKFIQIFCVGGGGGGGAARGNTTAGLPKKGGGGGASGNVTRGIFLAFLLPNTLYIQPAVGGAGGVGGSPGTGGTAGGQTYVSLAAATTSTNVLVMTAKGGGGGGLGSTSGIATPGANSSAAQTTADAIFMTLGIFTSAATVAGSDGNVNGDSQTALATNIVMGGAGGGGLSTTGGIISGSGGNITPANVVLLSPVSGGLVTRTAPSNSGLNGYGTLMPFCGTGGSGAGALGSQATPGVGGNGWYGCGGGGGGAQTGAATAGGSGGNGGDGLVIITTIF